MAAPQKKIKDYLSRSMRKLKHRKGFGVHSPFAYSIITEVIEEKLPYYAYRRMDRTYSKQSPIPQKVAHLLLRLANRFRCRNVAELCCDGGYSLLPLLLTDSRLHLNALSSAENRTRTEVNLSWLNALHTQLNFVSELSELEADSPYDMIVINGNPFDAHIAKPTEQQKMEAGAQLVDWVLSHAKDDTIIFVHGIQISHRQEFFWDQLCDHDEVSITMDLYDFGLAIMKPRFFKQHYVVAF